MSLYAGFAAIYDAVMADAPHQAWLEWLHRAQSEGFLPRLEELRIADVGCGTGVLTVALARRCREMVGVDMSEDMLAEAAARSVAERVHARWLCQDMRELALPFQADLVLSTCDSLNYLLTEDDWQATCSRVARSLSPGGWFCFDVHGPARLRTLEGGVWHDISDETVAVFETDVTPEGRISYELHAFQAQPSTDLYARIEERHEQQYVDPARVTARLQSCGLSVVQCMGDFGSAPIEEADRLVVIARKK